MKTFTSAEARTVRQCIADLVLGSNEASPNLGGNIELRDHQRSAMSKLQEALDDVGVGLLCDPVGTGKTYVALALVRVDSTPLVIAPAILREMWMLSASLCQRRINFLSVEALSRGRAPDDRFDLIIVDEAHHLRNPATRRYAMAAKVMSGSRVVFLTATPIHNRREDLVSLLALVIGERASTLDSSALSRIVIRREQLKSSIVGIPEIESLVWCSLKEESRILEMLLSLPPPVPPREGGDGGALIMHSLVRQWASSDAALRGALRRRLVRAESLEAALSSGEWPSSSELTSWIAGEDAVQLGFPGMLSPSNTQANELLVSVRAHRDAVKKVSRFATHLRADDERATLIRNVRDVHKGTSIVAFSQFADTIEGLFARLSPDGCVAMLSGSGARVAGGNISRNDAIAAFAPRSAHRAAPRRANAITLLLTTDLLSEGVNLQDAGVVIHLDLPWTPARLEQRLGRVARIGSLQERVHAYAIRPPVRASEIVRVEEILARKSNVAVREHSATSVSESIASHLERWRARSQRPQGQAFCAIESTATGFLAAVKVGGRVRLIACEQDLITDDPAAILRCLQRCDGVPTPAESGLVDSIVGRVNAWMFARSAMSETAFAQKGGKRARATRLVERIALTARPHDRARVARKAAAARAILAGRLSAYDERQIAATTRDSSADPLDEILGNRTAAANDLMDYPVRIEAIIALVKGKRCREQGNADEDRSRTI